MKLKFVCFFSLLIVLGVVGAMESARACGYESVEFPVHLDGKGL